VPHVTQFDEADITELEAFRKAQNEELKGQGVKLTPMAFLVKACVHALQTYPQFNASLEDGYKNLILKKYYNIGVAVETPDGLVVPVIKNADQKGILQLAEETSALAAKARDKKLPMDAMQGATFTISSLGGIGGTKFTPIVNAPEVAILGVSRSKVAPVWNGDSFVPRTMLPLSLSYDHRAIDGAEAARFTDYLARVLTDVRKLLL
jgi:pyruvate dehydrogenase E2 component (dihydrolipoamide acetyltransferase)